MAKRELFLGGVVDAATHDRTGEDLRFDLDDLTTHGVIVGMTGSGKTGLAVDLLEEALLAGVPTLILDPKGDMTNLALGFPELRADQFAPWVPPGSDPAEVAASWAEGLAGWGIDGSRIAALHQRAEVRIYTPGSTAGRPLNVIGTLAAPPTDDPEARRDEAEGVVSALLGLIGIDADPLASREHILLANLVLGAWSQGQAMDLGQLIGAVQDPPFRKLGVIDLDAFFPRADRVALALRLNGLLASPAFAAWAEGEPLDLDRLLGASGARPAAAVVYLAHLSEGERQFVVTLVLSKLVTWMRSQPGSAQLRVLVYMDEVYGYVPPTANPPAKKPILTLFKQARAYGVGVVLATQNPVDLDYKAISNAGTWLIGRLQTERDKARLLDGMSSAAGEVDLAALGDTLSGLDKRQFLLHQAGPDPQRVFTTRWAMSYLAGPLTKDQLRLLPGAEPPAPPAEVGAPAPADPTVAPVAPVGEHETTVAPAPADGIPVRYADPAAPWLAEVGASPAGTRWSAAAVFRAELLFDDTAADVHHRETWEAVLHPLGEAGDVSGLIEVDHDDRDLRTEAPPGAVYLLPEARIGTKAFWTRTESVVRSRIHADEHVELFVNRALDLVSRPDESAEAFLARCHAAAEAAEDAEADALRASLARRAARLHDQLEAARNRVADLEDAVASRAQDELVAGAGELLGSLLGGRRTARSLARTLRGASTRRSQTSRAGSRVERARHQVDARSEDLAELEAELADRLVELDDEWAAKAEAVEPLEVGLEKADITLGDVRLVWLPVEGS